MFKAGYKVACEQAFFMGKGWKKMLTCYSYKELAGGFEPIIKEEVF